jgi:flagellar hook-associated protein 3 FlgL
MRIADSTRYDAMRDNMQGAELRQFNASKEAASGLHINAPSDDPVAAAQAVRTSGASAKIDAYRAVIRNVRGDVELSESTLAQATDLMGRAHEIALQGASGNYNASERKDLAIEVNQLREAMLSLANQKGSEGYLFAGTKTNTPPFDASATFVGDDLDRQVEIGPNLVATVSASGARAFTAAGGTDVFAGLDALATALNANDVAGVQATVNSLDTASRQVIAARIDAGLKAARLDTSDSAHQETKLALSEQLNNLVAADPATAYSRFIQAGQAVSQAIAVAQKLMDTLGGVQLH